MNPEPKYHLSVVATSRNDNHGGSLTARTQHFIDGLVEQCKRHGVRAELILVEWNPPADRAPLADEMRWPAGSAPCEIRIVTVPREIHARLAHSDKLPLFQMIAKNVGIRRARGKYVLATNIDILFSDQVFELIAGNLPAGQLYRNDRCDIPPNVPTGVTFDEVLKFCELGMFRINANGFTAIRSGSGWKWSELFLARLDPRIRNAWFTGASAMRAIFHRIAIYPVRLWRGLRFFGAYAIALRIDQDGVVARLYAAVIRRLRGAFPESESPPDVFVHSRPTIWNLAVAGARLLNRHIFRMRGHLVYRLKSALLRIGKLTASPANGPKWLVDGSARILRFIYQSFVEKPQFTNGCGDFTLLSRDDWFKLRGYPEWEIFSWHIDSVFLAQARRMNIKETYLGWRARCFHIEHGKGSGYSPEGADTLFARLDANKIPYLSFEQYREIVAEMDALSARGQPVFYNSDDWGFSRDPLPETRVSGPVSTSTKMSRANAEIDADAARV